MKTFIAALAVSVVAIVPLTAQASPRAHGHRMHVNPASQSPAHASGQRFVARRHIYWQGQDHGTDPDPNIRFEIRREADYLTASNH